MLWHSGNRPTTESDADSLLPESLRRVRSPRQMASGIMKGVFRTLWKEVSVSAPIGERFVEGYLDLVLDTRRVPASLTTRPTRRGSTPSLMRRWRTTPLSCAGTRGRSPGPPNFLLRVLSCCSLAPRSPRPVRSPCCDDCRAPPAHGGPTLSGARSCRQRATARRGNSHAPLRRQDQKDGTQLHPGPRADGVHYLGGRRSLWSPNPA